MTRDHTVIEELLAVQALGGLDGDDVTTLDRELAGHGECDECARLRDEFDEVAGRLGFALDPSPVDPAMVDRILGRVVGEAPGEVAAPAVDELSARRSQQAGGRWRRLAAVAASFVVLAGGVAILRSGTTRVDAAQRFVTFEGDAGTFAMAYIPGEPGVVVWGRDLPDPGADKVYEVWMFTNDVPVSGGCLRPSDGNVAEFVDADIGGAQQMAVTVESSDCPAAPTSAPVFQASLA